MGNIQKKSLYDATLIGCVFYSLTVESFIRSNRQGNAVFKCRCKCGNTIKCTHAALLRGLFRSCGCSRAYHGDTNAKEYHAYNNIKARCLNEKNSHWHLYGGRGIKICDRWLESYEHFLSDVGRAPSKNHSIDRIDTNGNYEPGNCRWATIYDQSLNKRNSVYVTHMGITKPLIEWCMKFKLDYHRTYARIIKCKWTPERAFK